MDNSLPLAIEDLNSFLLSCIAQNKPLIISLLEENGQYLNLHFYENNDHLEVGIFFSGGGYKEIEVEDNWMYPDMTYYLDTILDLVQDLLIQKVEIGWIG